MKKPRGVLIRKQLQKMYKRNKKRKEKKRGKKVEEKCWKKTDLNKQEMENVEKKNR